MFAGPAALAASTLSDVMAMPPGRTSRVFAVAQHDEIPPDGELLFAQRMGATTVEVDSSHVVMTSHPIRSRRHRVRRRRG